MKRPEGFLISLYFLTLSPVRAPTPTQSSRWKSLQHLIYSIVPGDVVTAKIALSARRSQQT